MGKPWWWVLLAFASTAWAEDARVQSVEEPARITDTITVRTGLGPWVSPEAGLAWGHRLSDRVTVTLGFYGARNVITGGGDPNWVVPTTSLFTLEPGLRFKLNRAGVFVGANLAGGYALTELQGFHLRRVTGGGDLLTGIAHVFDGCLAVEVYAGVAGRAFFDTSDLSGTQRPTNSAVVALRAGIGVGWAF